MLLARARTAATLALLTATLPAQTPTPSPRAYSGIYPHLAMFNMENECGTGAVVPFADHLWAITYAPHAPRGSTDKLYEITPDLTQSIRPESIGGTPASRLIHRESNQLFLGPYVIDADRNVRVLTPDKLFGRLTGAARHLSSPADKVYLATMEEALYEVDVHTLEVTELFADEQQKRGRHADLPGYHGKGLYSGQGRVIYANNGEHGPRALRDPRTPSGVLASWNGTTPDTDTPAWQIIRRNQFTEVTGPGGIHGNTSPATDPIWSIGWDHRSLLLQVLDQGQWHTYRLPKGSHSYDGAHGWNTEWPRIRDIGEDDLLMTMHGLFWRFPRDFRPGHTAGIAPRSAYLKVIGDFCRWQDRLVFGCDDTARSEFLNKRRAKGEIAAPRSQSNLWFVEPKQLDRLAPARSIGALWAHEDVAKDTVSDPLLIGGLGRGGLHLAHQGNESAGFVIEVDQEGTGEWTQWQRLLLGPAGYDWIALPEDNRPVWLRIRALHDLEKAVAVVHALQNDPRTDKPTPKFRPLASFDAPDVLRGFVRTRGGDKTSMALVPESRSFNEPTLGDCFELDVRSGGGNGGGNGALTLEPTTDDNLRTHTLDHTKIPTGVIERDRASLIYTDDDGQRWRLPQPALGPIPFDPPTRIAREVATERDLFQAGRTFYELPARNAGGFRMVRPIASHDLHIHDYCSYRGLLVLTGLEPDAKGEHVVRSADGSAAVWVGTIDDLSQLGKPRGSGGPWFQTPVEADTPSDPFLVTGFDKKGVWLGHDADEPVTFTFEADLCGDGIWTTVHEVEVDKRHNFAAPEGWSAYWIRLRVDRKGTAHAQFRYR